ncbi:TIGR02444 family protein [Xanthobacter sp. DSM 24535]|uniref:TIGR02444 family protein n=1 Tax=Roseixanthobacter psychrophilus TaxID=3119917 RepID=UPI00372C280E
MEDTSLKTFALDLYGREGVSAACLRLQEKAGLNVNLLLFAAWFGGCRRRELSSDTAMAAEAHVAAWHREVVLPLRAVRRRLKTGPPPAPGERSAMLRSKVQAIEIEAEIVELDELDGYGRGLALLVSPAAPLHLAEAAMLEVVAQAAGRTADDQERADVAAIANAIAVLPASFHPKDESH